MNCIYLDNNATTPLLPAVALAMTPFLGGFAGNPASAHRAGRRARQALEDAREEIAGLLNAHPDEVVFTSGATEANNLALFGLAGDPPGHLIASPLEHPSVREPLRHLSTRGFQVDYLPVTPKGQVDGTHLTRLLRADTRLVTVMRVDHETGTIQPVEQAAREALTSPGTLSQGGKGAGVAFHCDAVQAAGKIPLDFHGLGVTTLALTAHKFHGPPGIGVLLVRRGTRLRPLFHGGHQQQGRRPGTEPVALVVGLARALALACQEQDSRAAHVRRLRELLLGYLSKHASPVVLNGPEDGMPHVMNLSFPGLEGATLLMALDLAGVACSTGSACSSGSLLPSPVLQAMGVPEERLRSAMRFSVGALTSEEEIVEAGRRISSVVGRLRRQVE